MGSSNSKVDTLNKMDCKQLQKTLEECCRKKHEDKIKGETLPDKDPCEIIKEVYVAKCDSKEDFQKQLINC
jgi:hypothetical protein